MKPDKLFIAQKKDGSFGANFKDTEIWGNGATEIEAVIDLKIQLVERVGELERYRRELKRKEEP